VKGKITKAFLLADPERKPLPVTQTATGVSIALPQKAPDPIASVVCLEIPAPRTEFVARYLGKGPLACFRGGKFSVCQ